MIRSALVLLALVVLVIVAIACAPGASHPSAPPSPATALAGSAPGPATFVATHTRAAWFHDSDSNLDLVQVLAWDDSAHDGVFVTIPASIAAVPGSYALDPSAPGVVAKFGVSHEGEDAPWDRQWYFGLYSGTLVIVTAGQAAGDRIAVVLDNAVFEFTDEHGQANASVTASVGITAPPLAATMDDDRICL